MKPTLIAEIEADDFTEWTFGPAGEKHRKAAVDGARTAKEQAFSDIRDGAILFAGNDSLVEIIVLGHVVKFRLEDLLISADSNFIGGRYENEAEATGNNMTDYVKMLRRVANAIEEKSAS